MITNEREIRIYYDPESTTGKMTLAYARSISTHVCPYPYGKTPSTLTNWRYILDALGLEPKDILNKANPFYQSNFRGREFDDEGWLNVIRYNPNLIKAPIAMRGSRAILCQTPTDIYRLV